MSEINRTISDRANSSFKKWKKYDSNMNFCDIDQEHDENMVFIDLLKVSTEGVELKSDQTLIGRYITSYFSGSCRSKVILS